jgi:hypothetical protein
VEPQAVFYRRLHALVTLARDGLMRYGALGPQLKEKFNQFGELLTFLGRVTDKQLAGRELSTEEYEQIKYYGATLERLSLAVMDAAASSWGELRSPTDKHMAVIADVHTASPEVLEVGVGPAYEILVHVPRPGGGRQLTRGAVFSYYEFPHPMSDRLTDEKWQELLQRRQNPPQPAWTDEYFIREPAVLPAKPVPYGSGC